MSFEKDLQYYKFCSYGFLKNLRFFEPFLILFFLEKNLTYLQIGTLYAIREIGTNILEIPTGILADVVGRRRSMIFSFASYIISFILFYIYSSFWLFSIAMIFFSIGEAFRTGTHKAMIVEYLKIKGWKNQKVHYYGHTRSASQIGSAVSSLIAAGLVFYSGRYQIVFLASTIPYILDLLLMMSYPKELDGKGKDHSENSIKKVFQEFATSIKDLTILRGIFNSSLYSGFHKATKDFLQPLLKTTAVSLPILLCIREEKRSALLIGCVYFVLFLLTSFLSRNAGKFAERFSHLSIPLNATLLLGFACGIFAGIFYMIKFFFFAIILYIAIYLLHNLRKPMAIGYISEIIPSNILATVLSTESQANSICAAILAPMLGWLVDVYGLGMGLTILSGTLFLLSPLGFVRRPVIKKDV